MTPAEIAYWLCAAFVFFYLFAVWVGNRQKRALLQRHWDYNDLSSGDRALVAALAWPKCPVCFKPRSYSATECPHCKVIL